MPYIKSRDREKYNHTLKNLKVPANVGELNYLLTKILHEYLKYKAFKYDTFNDIIGALESCKLEFYRRKTSQYEDKKIRENGDV